MFHIHHYLLGTEIEAYHRVVFFEKSVYLAEVFSGYDRRSIGIFHHEVLDGYGKAETVESDAFYLVAFYLEETTFENGSDVVGSGTEYRFTYHILDVFLQHIHAYFVIELLNRRVVLELHRLEDGLAVHIFYHEILLVHIGEFHVFVGREFLYELAEKFAGNESFSFHSDVGNNSLLYGKFGIGSCQGE